MASKEELKRQVETVCFKTEQTQEELAVSMGYGKTYISEMLSPRGKVSRKFTTALNLKYGQYLDNPKIENLVEEPGREYIKGDQQQLSELNKALLEQISEARRDLADQLAWMRDKIDANLGSVKSGVSSLSARQSVDREVVYRALSRLEKRDPDALLKEANRIMHGDEELPRQQGNSKEGGN